MAMIPAVAASVEVQRFVSCVWLLGREEKFFDRCIGRRRSLMSVDIPSVETRYIDGCPIKPHRNETTDIVNCSSVFFRQVSSISRHA